MRNAEEKEPEEWRKIDGFPYAVSSWGRVKRLPTAKRPYEHILTLNHKAGILTSYFQVLLGRGNQKSVHGLVCTAFNGPKPTPAHIVAHNDGCGTNNYYKNLRWATYKGNSDDRKLQGTYYWGENAPFAKLTESDVSQIRRLTMR